MLDGNSYTWLNSWVTEEPTPCALFADDFVG